MVPGTTFVMGAIRNTLKMQTVGTVYRVPIFSFQNLVGTGGNEADMYDMEDGYCSSLSTRFQQLMLRGIGNRIAEHLLYHATVDDITHYMYKSLLTS